MSVNVFLKLRVPSGDDVLDLVEETADLFGDDLIKLLAGAVHEVGDGTGEFAVDLFHLEPGVAADKVPVESVSLNFAKIKVVYIIPEGGSIEVLSWSWGSAQPGGDDAPGDVTDHGAGAYGDLAEDLGGLLL